MTAEFDAEVIAPPAMPGWILMPRGVGRGTIGAFGAGQRGGAYIHVEADDQPIDQALVNVTIAGAAGIIARVGLYRPRRPGSLNLDRVALSGDLDLSVLGVRTAAMVATLHRGLYVAVIEGFNAGATATISTVAGTGSPSGLAIPIAADPLDFTTDPRNGIHANSLVASAGLPASFAISATGSSRGHGPLIGLRAA